MTSVAHTAPRSNLYVHAFIAGFLAVLVFHQGMFTLLHIVGLTPAMPFPAQPSRPLGIPEIWSLAFWGGVWALVLAFLVLRRYDEGAPYWIGALLFGIVLPTLVAWFIVAPLKGQPIGNGFHGASVAVGPLVNGAWGIGTALFLRWHRA
jgi:hypothetical protein